MTNLLIALDFATEADRSFLSLAGGLTLPASLHAECQAISSAWPSQAHPIPTHPIPVSPDVVCPTSAVPTKRVDGPNPCRVRPEAQAQALGPAHRRPTPPNALTAFEVVTAVNGPHLRGARALLGWAMSDLAEVSGLSLSTIRRLEQNVQAVGLRSRRVAVEALEDGGVRFLRLEDGTLALAELADRSAGGAGTRI
ncbi:helix-turn-helix domain-containing protein [Methylobacterium sp. J-078]|uniref:helix-turn-helix domain-containing protein n=1 Tax=Methylobacterium sp. J-078 TaxID=2836657 RepID=UPI001FBA40E8|nr:hypothetical protein [Methylobacterium sp. J-078]